MSERLGPYSGDSVGSMFRRRILIGEVDPTLPRDGTDLIPLQISDRTGT